MNQIHQQNKQTVNRYRQALYDLDPGKLPGQLKDIIAPDCVVHLCHPLGDMTGPVELYEKVFIPLIKAVPDLERRDFIVMAGKSTHSGDWVGCAGHYLGVFENPWLTIPATCQPMIMRYHEYFRIEEDKIVEIQAIWDLIHLMMQADAWPLAPSLGVEWIAPSPATGDGLLAEHDASLTESSLKLVLDMLAGLQKHADGGPKAMRMERYWHPKMTWYGPSGIGANRRVAGFRNRHQIPFLKAMPNRGIGGESHFFAEGPYVAVTGWPNMRMSLSGDGWMGIAPSDREITMRSLDFWRCEKGLIRENWVLVDLLDVYRQLGVDVLARMRELTIARQPNRPAII